MVEKGRYIDFYKKYDKHFINKFAEKRSSGHKSHSRTLPDPREGPEKYDQKIENL